MKRTFQILLSASFLALSCVNLNSQILLDDPVFPEFAFPPILLSEGFNTSGFPPWGWSVQYMGTYSWGRVLNSANCLGSGSAQYQFYYAGTGNVARLISPAYTPTGGVHDTLIFFNAYASRPGIVDRMDIYTSTNSGTVWNMLTSLTTGLITAPATSTFYTPLCSQWQMRTFALPMNTNRVFFEAISNNGNNLYLDSIIIRFTYPSGIITYRDGVPQEYKLYDNFPNPFNSSTTVRFDILKPGEVKLIVYDAGGRKVAVLVNQKLNPGKYDVRFDASNLASGLYFYKLMAGDFAEAKKMLLVK